MILINATILMHRSTLSMDNFGNNLFGHFESFWNKQNILEFLGDYKGVRLKNFQRIEQKLEKNFSEILLESAKFENQCIKLGC